MMGEIDQRVKKVTAPLRYPLPQEPVRDNGQEYTA